MIIGIAALARAGKDTFADHLEEKHGFKKLNMSDVLRDELIKRGKEVTKLNMSRLGDEWRSKYGRDIVIRRVLEKAHDFKDVVITGIRSPEEAEYLKISSPVFFLVAVEAGQDIRFGRRTELDPQRRVDFFSRDQIDIENKGLGEVMAIADYRLKNEVTFEDLHREIDELMENLRKEEEMRKKTPPPEQAIGLENAKNTGVPEGLISEDDEFYE